MSLFIFSGYPLPAELTVSAEQREIMVLLWVAPTGVVGNAFRYSAAGQSSDQSFPAPETLYVAETVESLVRRYEIVELYHFTLLWSRRVTVAEGNEVCTAGTTPLLSA